eukprot:Clim_evm113s128 gene=Clim_evmTU113s128
MVTTRSRNQSGEEPAKDATQTEPEVIDTAEIEREAEVALQHLKDKETRADEGRPDFEKLGAKQLKSGKQELRRIPVPNHRYTPLKENWNKVYAPLVEQMKLEVRMNLKNRSVEIRNGPHTEDIGSLQKAADFVKAFTLGFDVEDTKALLRLDDLYVETFDVTDVKPLKGDHLSRAIGRIAGKGGQTKYYIENVSKTRIVLADTRVHILGSYQNIRVARDAIGNLILGSPPGKVSGRLRTVANRVAERF